MSIADQIQNDLANLVAGQDGEHVLSITYKPGDSLEDEQTWLLNVPAIPHPGDEPLIAQDTDLITYAQKTQRFSIMHSDLVALGRKPAAGDELVVADGTFAGTWRLVLLTPQLYMHNCHCVDHRPIGMGASEAHKVIS